MVTNKSFEELFHQAGVKLTHQRLIILEEVLGRRDHPSAEMIFQSVREKIPTVSLDTVYRTLWLFNELNLVTALVPERIRFDTDPTPHHHFFCTGCGDISDFVDDDFDRLSLPPSAVSCGRPDRVQVEFHGICCNCLEAPRKG